MIIGSCFLDDVFILFLFNSGRYLIVNGNSGVNKVKNTNKKSSTS
jgi:hypothetical protein